MRSQLVSVARKPGFACIPQMYVHGCQQGLNYFQESEKLIKLEEEEIERRVKRGPFIQSATVGEGQSIA